MKKLKYFLALSLVVLLASGCEMVAHYETTISSNKNVTQRIIIAVDNEMVEGMLSMENMDEEGTTYTEEEKWQMVDSMFEEEADFDYEGFTKERYETPEGLKGYQYTKELGNIDTITGDEITFTLDDGTTNENLIMFQKRGNNYFTEFEAGEPVDTSDTEGYDITYNVKYIVHLPSESISNNATEVSEDGKTLTWDLTQSLDTISYEFAFSNNTVMYIIIGVLVVCAIVAFVLLNKKKKN